MSDYRDYGYSSAEPKHTSAYLIGPLLAMLDPARHRAILELGCGNGWVAHALLERGFEAWGTDASESGIRIAAEGHPGRFFLQDLSTDELPDELRARNYDTLLAIEVIEHLYAPARFFDFCAKVLRAGGGGELIVSTPYHGYLKNLALAATGALDGHFTALWEGGHIKFWSRATLSRALEQAGFTVEEFRGCGRLPYLWKSMLVRARV